MTTLPNPTNYNLSFATRQELLQATIPAPVNRVMADGLIYERDASGTAATTVDGGTWAPSGDITPMHFGAVGDGVTDDVAAVQAAADWAGVVAARTEFLVNARNTFGVRTKVTGAGRLYGIGSTASLTGSHRNISFQDISFIAVGTWTSGETIARNFNTQADMISSGLNTVGEFVTTTGLNNVIDGGGETYEIVADSEAENADGVLYIQLTGIAAKARRVNFYMFDCGGLATFIRWQNVQINAENKCGGIIGRARHRFVGCWFDRIRHVGIEGAGSDVWITECIIRQWSTNDVEYYDPVRYTGVGIYLTESDSRVTSCTVSWMSRLIVIESTNNIIEHCHMFNGMQNYLAADRNPALTPALNTYFGRDTTGENFPRRDEHVGIQYAAERTTQGSTFISSFDEVYFDNCHHELYADTLAINNCKFGSKDSSSLRTSSSRNGPTEYGDTPTITWWFRLHAYEVNTPLQFQMLGFETYVSSAPRFIVKFRQADGNTWAADYSNINQDLDLNYADRVSGLQEGDGFAVMKPHTIVSDSFQGPIVTYKSARGSSRIAFESNTSSAASEIRETGDALQMRPAGTTMFEVNPSGPRMINPTVPATASSTGSAGQYAFDNNYFYVCTGTDTWKRVAISTWT